MKQIIKQVKKFWNKYTQGWTGNIIYVILGFAIAYGLNFALGLALSTDMPVVAVVSCSMYPTLDRGDIVFVSGDKNYSTGDIIVYDASLNYPIIHRIINFEDEKIRTKGDNNPSPDPWITKNVIHGKAFLKAPLLGWVKIIFMKAFGILDQPLEFCSR